MMLSSLDVECLERAGYGRKEFVRFDRQGFAKLRNRGGYCVFYDAEKRCCKTYEHRPLGCRTYPVIYSEEEGIVVDELCPMRGAVSRMELRRKGKKVIELLKRIDDEAACRRETT